MLVCNLNCLCRIPFFHLQKFEASAGTDDVRQVKISAAGVVPRCLWSVARASGMPTGRPDISTGAFALANTNWYDFLTQRTMSSLICAKILMK